MFGYFLVEDGTEHDYDSHIMVWNLAGGSATTTNPSSGQPPVPPSTSSLSSSSVSLRPLSAGSSSLELGPTPGSGLDLDTSRSHSAVTDSGSEDVADDLTTIETGTDPLAWSREVERMMNNPPPSTFKSFNLAAEPSLSSWLVPHAAAVAAAGSRPVSAVASTASSPQSTCPPSPRSSHPSSHSPTPRRSSHPSQPSHSPTPPSIREHKATDTGTFASIFTPAAAAEAASLVIETKTQPAAPSTSVTTLSSSLTDKSTAGQSLSSSKDQSPTSLKDQSPGLDPDAGPLEDFTQQPAKT